MSLTKIGAALSTQLATLGLPTAWENSRFKPTAGQVYLAESLIAGNTIAVGFANQASDEYGGIYQVLIYSPIDVSKGIGRSTADIVAAAFVRGDRLVYDDVTVTILSTSQAAAFMSGDRWVIPVSVTYRAFI
jgi:homoserine kinase